MIELYYWPTPNGWKISIALEELGLRYVVKPVNLGRGEQFAPEFLSISPNNRIPALVDHDPPGGGPPFSSFESGAMLMYLADKTGRLLPADWRGRHNVLPWLAWQVAELGPMLDLHDHYLHGACEQLPYALERQERETWRLYGVLDEQLGRQHGRGGTFVMGDYSIADIAIYPWIMAHKALGLDLQEFGHVKRWFSLVGARAAVQRGLAAGKDLRSNNPIDQDARRQLFGSGEEQTRPQDL